MADNVTANPGSGGATFASDDIGGIQYPRMKVTFGEDGSSTDASATNPLPITALSLPLPTGAATEATLASALAALVSIAGDDTVENILRQLLQAAISPAGFDRSLGRGRVTALVESGTVTTVTTVTTVSTVTTVAGLTNIDGRNGAMLINQTNLSAWADCVRARIT